jgi:hypothetical protein
VERQRLTQVGRAMRNLQPQNAYVPARGKDLERIFPLQRERIVNQDNIHLANRTVEIEKTKWCDTLDTCRLLMCEHLNASLSVFYGGSAATANPAVLTARLNLVLGEIPPPAGFPRAASTTKGQEANEQTGHLLLIPRDISTY